ncbi:MAG: hypothetical protein WAM13_06790 [Candidatus Sulfotelmatobacter sp.]
MPSKADHAAKAAHNETFVSSLGDPYWDWAVSGVFYTALHYVEAYLATKRIHSGSHPVRDSNINRDSVLRAIYPDYRELKDESRAARYDVVPFTRDDLAKMQKNLDTIRGVISPHII